MSFLNKSGQIEGSQNNRTGNSSWGGFLKQAINSVENSLEKAAQDKQKEGQESLTKSKSTTNVAKPSLDQDRLAARLAAAVSNANVPKKSHKGRKGKAGGKKKPLGEGTSNPLDQQVSSTNVNSNKQDVSSLNSVSTRSSAEVAWDPLQGADIASDTGSVLETEKDLESENDISVTLEDSNNDKQVNQQEILNIAIEVPLPLSEVGELADKNVVENEQTQPPDNDGKGNVSLRSLRHLNEPEAADLAQNTTITAAANDHTTSEVVETEIVENQSIPSSEPQNQNISIVSDKPIDGSDSQILKENAGFTGESNNEAENDPSEVKASIVVSQAPEDSSIQEIDTAMNQESNADKKVDDEKHTKEGEQAKLTIQDQLKQCKRQLAEKLEENTNLSATIAILKTRLKSAQEESQNALKASFSGNGMLEKRIDHITKERDQAREKLAILQREMQQIIAQKDQRISDLFTEGERLSRQELKLNNMVKQLRAKGVENEKVVVDLKRQCNDSQKEVTALKGRNAKFAESEKKLNDACKSLRKLSDEQSLRISKLESQLQESKEAQIDLQVALERAWDDLNKSRKTLNESLADLKKQSQENEDKIREELQQRLQKSQAKYEQTIEGYKQEVAELQDTITRLNDDAGDNEDELRKEISILQMRIQSSEQRFQDLNANHMNSTQPLLKQIEALENRHSAAQKHWEKVEERLTKELSEAKMRFESSEAKCKDSCVRIDELTHSNQELEVRLQNYEKDIATVQEYLQAEKDANAKARLRIQELSDKLEVAQKDNEENIERIKQDYEERLLKQKEELLQTTLEPVGEVSDGRISPSEDEKRGSDSDVLSPTRMSFDGLAFPLSPIISSSSNEVLRAQIKNLESQITSLQAQLQLTIKDRDEISNELVQMTLEYKETSKDMSKKTASNDDQIDLKERYDSVLHELAEKSELVEELKSDISDMKEMYRVQIAELVNKIEKLMRK